jgi:hypothetical protein
MINIDLLKEKYFLNGYNIETSKDSLKEGKKVTVLKRNLIKKNEILKGVILKIKEVVDYDNFGIDTEDLMLTVILENNKLIQFLFLNENDYKEYFILKD